jgi:hypothetical protein
MPSAFFSLRRYPLIFVVKTAQNRPSDDLASRWRASQSQRSRRGLKAEGTVRPRACGTQKPSAGPVVDHRRRLGEHLGIPNARRCGPAHLSSTSRFHPSERTALAPRPHARESRSAPAARCAHSLVPATAPPEGGSPVLVVALSCLASLALRARRRPAGHRGPLAPQRLAPLLDVEESTLRWPSTPRP